MSSRTKTGLGIAAIGLAFFIVSLVFIVIQKPWLKYECTETVQARIIGYDEARGYGGVLRGDETMDAYQGTAPIFQYEYQGVTYTGKYHVYDGLGNIIDALLDAYPEGIYPIQIDPDEPTKIYVEEMSNTIGKGVWAMAIVGGLVIFLGIVTIIDKNGAIVKVAH